MPGTIVEGALSPSQVVAPGLYVSILPPPSFSAGVATNVGGLVGSATWGPVGTPVLCGGPSDYLRTFGQVPSPTSPSPGADFLTAPANPFDMGTYAMAAFAQSRRSGGVAVWCVRATDGTDAQASGNILDTTAVTPLDGLPIKAFYTGSLGNSIKTVVTPGSKGTGYATATVVPPSGLGLVTEVYPNIPTGATLSAADKLAGWQTYSNPNSQFWGNLRNAMLAGIQGGRGPSALIKPGTASLTALAPATTGANATAALTGGLDGTATVGKFDTASSLADNIIGSNASTPVTGMYTLEGLNPPVAGFCLCGFGEAAGTAYVYDEATVAATVEAFAQAAGAYFVSGLPLGIDNATATGVTLIQSTSVDDWIFIYAKDHPLFNDGVNGSRFISPAPGTLGALLTGAPQNSPINTTFTAGGTYRTSSLGSPAPYSPAEIGQCQSGRILLITSPIPSGPALGFATGVNASSNPATSPVEYTTLTLFIAKSLAASFGKWIGQNQGIVDPDPTRSGAEDDLTLFLEGLLQAGQIAAYSAVCNLSNNPKNLIAQHFLFAQASATYLASVWFFLLSFTGGTTVQVQVAQGAAA